MGGHAPSAAAAGPASTTRQQIRGPRSGRINTPVRGGTAAVSLPRNPIEGARQKVADLLFVVLTVVLFAALTVLVRAVERW